MTDFTIALLGLSALLVPLAFTFGCQPTDTSSEGKSPTDEGNSPDSTVGRASVEPPTNHLADQSSLYLLMHAHNPVDWYPWGEEALKKAKAENKLIFLSIGYSSCYWCHVMERESFMDEEVARLLNEHFVSIKVDREERPDIDEIYMTALQIYFRLIRSPQGGGWPLNIFLTPDAKPLMGGTYFPPRDKGPQTGLVKVLALVQKAWQENEEQLRENADVLTELVEQQLQHQPAAEVRLSGQLVDGVLEALADQYDPEYGGFGYGATNPRMPKFPQPSNLVFLLDRAERERGNQGVDGQAEPTLITTLEEMAAGGIRDHLGGGFHRYSTDRFWAIPHFEKMLYDNAQLASVYAEAYRLTGREDFRRTVEEILEFVSREMTGPTGGFYSAIDAETDGDEGQYYVWKLEELVEILDPEQLQLLGDVYGTDEEPNFEGRYVLLYSRPLRQTAEMRRCSEEQLLAQLAPIREKLLQARSQRTRPLTDTKVLTAWTGLMIRGFADAGRLLDNQSYIQTAEKAANFVLEKLHTDDGRLFRTFGGDRAQLNAYLNDYAFLIDGLIALHRATGEQRWLQEAQRLTATQIDLFWDQQRGGFFFTSSDHETLIARSKDPTDSALPSGNAVSAGNLVYLAEALDRLDYLDRAQQTIEAFTPLLEQSPAALPRMAVSLAALLDARR
jgi:uncharacterized protein YyaL (SSP411 family)